MFANFFLQCVIANAAKDKDMHEQDLIVANLKRDLSNRALSRYSCRVVQKAVEVSSGGRLGNFQQQNSSSFLVAFERGEGMIIQN